MHTFKTSLSTGDVAAVPAVNGASIYENNAAELSVLYDQTFAGQTGLVNSVLDKDYNSRPNMLNPYQGTGPYPDGFEKIAKFYATVFPTFNIKRLRTATCQPLKPVNGQFVAAVNTIEAKVANDVGRDGLPMFPGINATLLRGKSFKTLAINVHLVRDEKILRTWHAEDWITAVGQMLKGHPEPLLDMPVTQPGKELTEFPKAMSDIYGYINNPDMKSS